MEPRDKLPLTPLTFQILVALADEPRHGYGIIKEIERSTEEPFPSSTGTLYLALDRLLEQELVEEHPRNEGRRRYYRLTRLGRDVAGAEARRLASLLSVARGKKLVDRRALDALLKGGSARRG